jgi:hypothetical protein
MTWFVGAIAKESAKNWAICKELGLYGISTAGRSFKIDFVRKGDGILVWQAGTGWIAVARATDNSRVPIDRNEAPWGGGLHRFGLVVPFKVEFEPSQPIFLRFENYIQTSTGLPQNALHRGFSQVSDEVAGKVIHAMGMDEKSNSK